jgi:hypothetical protein
MPATVADDALEKGHEDHRRGTILVGPLRGHVRVNGLKLGQSPLRGDVRGQPSDEIAFACPVPSPLRMHRHDGRPGLGRGEEIELLGHDSDDLERLALGELEGQSLADDCRVRAKALPPHPVAQYERGDSRRPVVLGPECPSQM